MFRTNWEEKARWERVVRSVDKRLWVKRAIRAEGVIKITQKGGVERAAWAIQRSEKTRELYAWWVKWNEQARKDLLESKANWEKKEG